MHYENASKASELVLFALLLISWHGGAKQTPQLPLLGAEDTRLLRVVRQNWVCAAAWLIEIFGFLFQLYESALSENQKLKSKLQEAQLELADIKSKLEKAAQVRQKPAPRLEKLSTGPWQASACSSMGKDLAPGREGATEETVIFHRNKCEWFCKDCFFSGQVHL